MFNYDFRSAQPVSISTHTDSSLFVTHFCHSDSYPEWSFPLHIHRDQLEISYVLSGHGLFTLNTTAYPVEAGDLMVAEAGYIHAHCSPKQDPLNMIVLQFSWDSKENREHVLLPVNTFPVIPTGDHRPYFQASFQLLDRLLREKDTDEGLCCQVVGSSLALLMRLPLREIVEIPQKSTFTRDILVYINENFRSNITLKTLSDRFAVSSSHISNEFTRIYGVSPIHYLIDIRLSIARGFLISTSDSVQEIALRVGYENCNHFTNLFLKRIGTSPNEYRKHHASLN